MQGPVGAGREVYDQPQGTESGETKGLHSSTVTQSVDKRPRIIVGQLCPYCFYSWI